MFETAEVDRVGKYKNTNTLVALGHLHHFDAAAVFGPIGGDYQP